MPANQFEHHDSIVKLHAKIRESLTNYADLLNDILNIRDVKGFFEAYEDTAVLFQLLDRYIRYGNVMDYRYICRYFMEEVNDAS